MGDPERRKRGEEMIKKVYAGDVIVPPENAMPFTDLMLEQLFAEVWSREEQMAIRDRRLVLLQGVDPRESISLLAGLRGKPGEEAIDAIAFHADPAADRFLERAARDRDADRRREQAIMRAQMLPTKLAVPLVVCFLPGIFVYTFGPALAQFVQIAEGVVQGGQ